MARREPSKPVDGGANSSPSFSNGVKESRPVRTGALYFRGRQVGSEPPGAIEEISVPLCRKLPEDGEKIFVSAERGQERGKMAKRGAARRFFRV